MRVPNAVHAAHNWVMATIAPDFTLLDVWALPADGARADFPAFLETVTELDPAKADSAPTRALFALRFKLGELFGWDDTTSARPIPGCIEATLAARLPNELQGSAAAPRVRDVHGFTPIYRTDDEWSAEISNATVHGVLQLTWVEQGNARYQAQLAVYVKARGILGQAYLRLIDPFRHLIVYPALTRQIGRAWEAHQRRATDASARRSEKRAADSQVASRTM